MWGATTGITNTVQDFQLNHQTSGTPASSIGTGLTFAIETAAANTEIGAAIRAIATDVDPTNEDFDLVFYTMLSGDTATEVLRLHDDNTATFAGTVAATLSTASQTNITGLGTITTGVWSATDVAVAAGGTGASTAGDARTNLGLVIETDVAAYNADALFADVSDNLTVGFTATENDVGDTGTTTITLDATTANFWKAVNGGAHTLTPQTATSTIVLYYLNAADAGAVTTSGYDIVTGDSLTTTNTEEFMLYSTTNNGKQHLHVVALQ